MFDAETIEQFNSVVREAEIVAFLPRDSDLQVAAVARIDRTLDLFAGKKSAFVTAHNEDGANACLAAASLLTALKCELQMWLALKRDEPEAAWDLLISAQNSAAAALRAHECGTIAEPRLSLYAIIERYFFPPQVFVSTGFLVHQSHCSVCEQPYDDCPHIKGRPYMGQFCSQVMTQLEPREVSFVDEPRDKRCRATHFLVQGGRRNRMTWRIEPDPPKRDS